MKEFYKQKIELVLDKEDKLYQRIEKLAQESGRSVKEIVELLVYDGLHDRMVQGLPIVERTFRRYEKNRTDG